MTFKDFIKSKQLCEMAFNLKEAKTITFLQLDSTVDHLLKVYIGQDLISAQPGKDWEIQIDNFLNKIKNIRLKTSKKNITQSIFRDELTKIIKDCKEDSRIPSLTKEIRSYNYDGTPLYTPKDEKKLLDYIEVFLLNISRDIEKDENNFKQMYPRYLEKMREF